MNEPRPETCNGCLSFSRLWRWHKAIYGCNMVTVPHGEGCLLHKLENASVKEKPIPPGWNPMSSAPRDGTPILGWCLDGADLYSLDGGRTLTTYADFKEDFAHVKDGPCVLVFGGGFDDGEDGWLPDWWFMYGSEFDVVANPVFWKEIEEVDAGTLSAWQRDKKEAKL